MVLAAMHRLANLLQGRAESELLDIMAIRDAWDAVNTAERWGWTPPDVSSAGMQWRNALEEITRPELEKIKLRLSLTSPIIIAIVKSTLQYMAVRNADQIHKIPMPRNPYNTGPSLTNLNHAIRLREAQIQIEYERETGQSYF